MKKINISIPFVLVTILLTGCENKPVQQAMPEVNDKNCQIENIRKIEDKAMREQFAGLCARRPGRIAPSDKPKNWLEFSHPKGGDKS